MKEITDRKKCTGCGACAGVCPKNCISMVEDCEGFLRPAIDSSRCVNCNLCQKTCPVNGECKSSRICKCFGGNVKDRNLRKESSSGGLFSVLAESVIASRGIVFGAVFEDNYRRVRHIYAGTQEELYRLRTSKYVQSEVGDSYHQVKAFLEKKKTVLFCGTPCQVAGLKSFLKKDYKNLITIDFICHGVPSPRIWRSYVDYRANQMTYEIQNVSFRDKQTGWRNYSLKIETMGGCYSSTVSKDEYLKGFVNNLTIRPSCYQCCFKEGRSESDITLADFWGVDSIAPELNDDTGMSLLLIHTEAGQKLLSEVRNDVKIFEITEEQGLANNISYYQSVSEPKKRDSFFRYAAKKGDVSALKKYTRTTVIVRLKVFASGVISICNRKRSKEK